MASHSDTCWCGACADARAAETRELLARDEMRSALRRSRGVEAHTCPICHEIHEVDAEGRTLPRPECTDKAAGL